MNNQEITNWILDHDFAEYASIKGNIITVKDKHETEDKSFSSFVELKTWMGY